MSRQRALGLTPFAVPGTVARTRTRLPIWRRGSRVT
jgi:hypothetical protein